jgi:hypothetical protein
MTPEGSVIRRSLLLLVVVPVLAACSAGASSASPSATGTAAPSGGRPSFEMSPPFETVPPTAPPVTGEVPEAIMAQARADLAKLTGLDPSTFTTVRDEQVVWSDGSLGCPVPGVMYIQVVTPGYWIQLGAGGRTYDYRSTLAGPVRRCDLATPKPPSG